MNEHGDVWKWVPALLAAILLAGAPPYIGLAWALLRSPSKEEVDLIRDRQQSVLQRLAALDERLEVKDSDNEDIRMRVQDLEAILRQRR